MLSLLFRAIFVGISSLLFLLWPSPKKPCIYLIGDSTMSVKDIDKYPETGWGMPFAHFFDSTVILSNHAKNGRSTRTFMEENRWKTVFEQLSEGDFVLIQFGHNDEVKTKKSYTTESEFKKNLHKFISDCKEKKASPILLTPASRRKFDSTGIIINTHSVYAQLVKEVAVQASVPLIDLNQESMTLLQKMGPNTSTLLFNYLEKGEHPNYPDGLQDDTHFNELGARKMAELVIREIQAQHLPLANYIVKAPLKK